MKCDKLFKEAFEGIEFRYKLDDTLENLGNQKLTAKQLEGFLLGKGVSPKEIKQSSILKGMENDNRALSGSEWLSKSGSQRLTTYNVAPDELSYDTYTLGRKGTDNETYNETLTTIKKPSENAPETPHFSNEIATPVKSLLGWRRTHVDEINGKKTLVLNELQSDWAQTERAGRGTFESNLEKNKVGVQAKLDEIMSREEYERLNSTPYKDLTSEQIDKMDEYAELDEALDPNLVADFPMTELKHNQFQIVGAIDEALKQGIDTVAIPIQRENELAGSAGVTKFYENLNTKVLPDIRKKLEKQGLRIKVDKKPYKKDIKVTPGMLNKSDIDMVINNLYDNGVKEDLIDTELDNIFAYLSEGTDFGLPNILKNNIDEAINFLQRDFSNYSSVSNDLWTLTIEEVPSGKVKWDVYSVLAALGLGGVATQSEATTKMQDNPDIYQLSKRVGAKLNYNESNKEIIDYIISIESGGDYKAKNKDSSAFGKYQILRGTMVEKAKELGITLHEARRPEGQEQVMNSLLSDYKERLKQFDLPVTKENVFVLHNLGQTRGVRILRGTYSDSDINAMRVNLPTQERKLPRSAIPQAYAERYNINVPNKQED